MNLRTFLPIIFFALLLISCRDNKTNDTPDTLNTEENEYSPVDRNIPRTDVDEEEVGESGETQIETSGNVENSKSNKKDPGTQISGTKMTGQFIKTGQEADSNCACYCLDLTSDSTELCLVEGEMYIDTRLQRNADNTIDVFLVEPSGRNNHGKDIPWKDFDRNNAIATIKPGSGGELELDWLGFMINGDLAVDYAIFGKKTLEGNYTKR